MNKLRDGVQILAWLLVANLRLVLRGFANGPIAGLSQGWVSARRLACVAHAILRLRGHPRLDRLADLCLESGIPTEQLTRNPEAAYAIAKKWNERQGYADVIALVDRLFRERGESPKLLAARGFAHLFLGHYSESFQDMSRVAELNPVFARDEKVHFTRAFLLGMRGDQSGSRQAMADQVLPSDAVHDPATGLARYLHDRLAPYWGESASKGEVAVVFGDYYLAVGHAILDPYHHIQLFGHRFDHFILVHPPYDEYQAAPRLSARIIDQHFDQIETNDIFTRRFAWQWLGELRHGNVTFLVHHYWSLNRLVFLARKDPNHPLSRGRTYFELPPKVSRRAEAILHRAGFDPGRPFVVVHSREHGYHALNGQAYRNADIRNYVPALRRLIELGHQVVRIGDRKMTSLREQLPEIVELPIRDDYEPALDPYVISHCRFMISCQSGPCSYARAFGKPNLVINAVYHYTLLPERQELLGFKTYRDKATGEPMGLEAIFHTGAHLFDRTDHFEKAGIAVEDMTPDEILAATEEMLEWLDDPDRPESANQTRFRERMEWYSANPDPSHPLAHPMSDYVGYSLPECRISDAVCRLRPGFLKSPASERIAA